MSFLRKLTLILVAIITVGCSAKRVELPMMPVPEPHTREAMLLQFQPSGSPCLDALVVNLSSAGCAAVHTTQVDAGIIVSCAKPQPGSKDVYSKYSFIVIAPGKVAPENAYFYCADSAGQIGYYPYRLQPEG